MPENKDKFVETGEGKSNQSWWKWLAIATAATLGISLVQCNDIKEIHFNGNAFKYDVKFEGREAVMATVTVRENKDSTFSCKINRGPFSKNLMYTGSEQAVHDWIKESLRKEIPKAQLNSEESIENLGYASDAKCDYAFQTYHEYRSDSTKCSDEYTVTYTPAPSINQD